MKLTQDTHTLPDESFIKEILQEVEAEYQMGGLSFGLYGDYATQVAKRFAAHQKQELIEIVRKVYEDYPMSRPDTYGEGFDAGVEAGLLKAIAALKKEEGV